MHRAASQKRIGTFRKGNSAQVAGFPASVKTSYRAPNNCITSLRNAAWLAARL